MFNQVCLHTNQLIQVREVSSSLKNRAIAITHCLEENAPDFILELAAFYYQEPAAGHNFNLLIHNASGTDFLNQAGILFAHPNYLKTEKGLSVFYNAEAKGLRALLATFLDRQGFTQYSLEGIAVPIIQTNGLEWHLMSNQGGGKETSASSFGAFYQDYLNTRYQYQDMVLVSSDSHATLAEVVGEVEKAVAGFKEMQPHLSGLFQDLFSLHKQSHLSALLAEIRAKEIATLHDLFRENAQHKETEYILNFYTQEYEVLPLWYKRMGHIIKAMMGKRSWKSLLQNSQAR